MKESISALFAAALLSSCAHLLESDAVGPEIRGAWTGQGRFLDRNLGKEYGSFPVGIDIHADNSVSCSVGSAKLTEAIVKCRPEDFLIEGKLAEAIFDRGNLLGETRECVVFLLSPPESETTAGNIHLKTNRAFDATMRVCGVELTRGQ